MRLLKLVSFLPFPAGCTSSIYYSPNTLNVPMISEKNQGSLAIDSASESIDFRGAYSPRANLGVIASGSKIRGDSGRGSGYLVEGGAGYYRRIKSRLLWDAYGLVALAGVGNPSTSMASAGFSNKARYLRYGVQPSFGFQSTHFDLAGAARLVRLSYFDIRGATDSDVAYLKAQPSQFLIEPVVNLRVGWESVRIELQVGHSFNMTNKAFLQKDDIASLGIVYTFKR